jgi:fructose-bisphosphate aldolase, class I
MLLSPNDHLFISFGAMRARLNRLFAPDKRCVNVAVDHGLFNERSFLGGIGDMPSLVQTLSETGVDAIQLSVGQARLLQEISVVDKPALALRADVANVYGHTLPTWLFSEVGPDVVETAVRLDAACIVANLLLLPDRPEVHGACVRNIQQLQPKCERYGMPLMIEPLVMQANERAGGYQIDGDVGKIATLVRQAVELGATVIKADPTDDVDDYAEVIEVAAGLPLLVRGGGKADLCSLVQRIARLLELGAAGIVFGRNIFQQQEPAAVARMFAGLVHGRVPLEAALSLASELDSHDSSSGLLVSR